MIIILLGYMTSGKSTIGRLLSQKLRYDFIDLDHYIEKKVGASIENIFKSKGEIYFRTLEHQSLNDILEEKGDLVLSLGGGTPCYANNMNVINKNDKVLSLYLKASIGTIVERLWHEKSKRPLVSHIKDREQLLEFVGKHLFERAHFYEQADYNIDINRKPSKVIVEEIEDQLF
ncbi:MAG: shikimate kinase [Flavobacteriaceae bacterium]|nr:shikimate kinase [Flavobacteriaceae bacterium]